MPSSTVHCLDRTVGSASSGAEKVTAFTSNGPNAEARSQPSQSGADSVRGCSTRASNRSAAPRSFDSSRAVSNAVCPCVCPSNQGQERPTTPARRCRLRRVRRSLAEQPRQIICLHDPGRAPGRPKEISHKFRFEKAQAASQGRKTFLRNHGDGIASTQRSTDAAIASPAVAAEKSTPS
jgi:hypothetical protein